MQRQSFTLKGLLLCSVILISTIIPGNSQNTSAKNPLPYSGNYPEDFTENYKQKINAAVEAETNLSKKKAKIFYEELYQTKAQLFSSGQIYFENRLQKYVRDVAGRLLEKNPAMKSKIRIYVSRSWQANAFALAEGTIIINVGLLARMENEAQLASIIAHELSHVEKNHSVKSLTKMEEIESQQINYENTEGEVFRRLKYSREDESEADSRAIQLMMGSPYDPRELPAALAIIGNKTYFKFDKIAESLQKDLIADQVTPDSSWFKKPESENSGDDETDLVFSSDYDDLFSTHPDVEKRISAAKEILALVDFKGDDKSKNLLGDEYKQIKEIALTELIENMLKDSEYSSSLYLSLWALKNNPENIYLKTALIRSLYWLSYYKEIACLDKLIESAGEISEEDFAIFNQFLKKIPHNDLKKIMFSYVKKNLESSQSNDDFFFYYGLSSEMYLGKDPGKIIFNQYLLKFPYGKYTTSVKARIQ